MAAYVSLWYVSRGFCHVSVKKHVIYAETYLQTKKSLFKGRLIHHGCIVFSGVEDVCNGTQVMIRGLEGQRILKSLYRI